MVADGGVRLLETKNKTEKGRTNVTVPAGLAAVGGLCSVENPGAGETKNTPPDPKWYKKLEENCEKWSRDEYQSYVNKTNEELLEVPGETSYEWGGVMTGKVPGRETQGDVKLTCENIIKRIEDMAKSIFDKHQDDKHLDLVTLMNGGLAFTKPLAKKLQELATDNDKEEDWLRQWSISPKSYDGTNSSGEVQFDEKSEQTLQELLQLLEQENGGNVVIGDDISDTGNTFDALIKKIPQSPNIAIETAVMLDKQGRRDEKNEEFVPDYCGFNIENKFVIGYGLDYEEVGRDLPFIGYIKEKAA